MLPCHDNYTTTFDNYPSMLSYHKALSVGSSWKTCKVKDLHVEPLDGTSPLYGHTSAFAAGTSEEAVTDTVENLGLALPSARSSRAYSAYNGDRSTAHADTFRGMCRRDAAWQRR